MTSGKPGRARWSWAAMVVLAGLVIPFLWPVVLVTAAARSRVTRRIISARFGGNASGRQRSILFDMSTVKLPVPPRLATPVILLALSIGAAVAIIEVRSATTKTVFIGLASTLMSAGLVDLSAALESRRRDQETRRRELAVLGLAAERAMRASQQLLQILTTVFDAAPGDVDNMSARLRASEQTTFDPDQPASVFPPRPKGAWINQCVTELDDSLRTAVALGTQTPKSEVFAELDAALRVGAFMGPVHSGLLSQPLRGGADILARDAADTLDRVQALLPQLDSDP